MHGKENSKNCFPCIPRLHHVHLVICELGHPGGENAQPYYQATKEDGKEGQNSQDDVYSSDRMPHRQHFCKPVCYGE